MSGMEILGPAGEPQTSAAHIEKAVGSGFCSGILFDYDVHAADQFDVPHQHRDTN
jgi:hypothetical protein